MKRCPECSREYDSSMMFCLDDGTELLYGPASMSEPQTAILHSTPSPDYTSTRAQINTTDPTATFQTGAPDIVPKPARFWKRTLMAACVLAVVTIGGFVGYKYFSSTRQIDSIAVLPLTNAGGDPSTEYLTDGVTESLINSLSQVPGLRVVPRSTVFRYKGELTDPAELGQRLGVQAVLTGRVVQRGDRLEVQAELIDISHNAQMWGERYSRSVTDVQAVQREIANAVARELSAGNRPVQQLSSTYTAKSDA